MAADGMIVMGTQYDADNMVKYTQPKVNAAGGKNVGILNKKTSKSTIISAPLMMTWGVNEWKDDASGKVSYDLSLQFPDSDSMSDNVKKFLDNLIAFEKKIKADAAKFSREWFNKPSMSADVVDALFTPMLRYPKNKDTMEPDYTRSPSLKVKIPFWEGDFKTEIYDMKQNTLFPDQDSEHTPVELIGKGSQIASIIKNGGIWFAAGKFGTTWKLEQAVVQPRATLRGKCHIQLDESEMQSMETSAKSDSDNEQENVVDTSVVDSDDEEANVTVTTTDVTTDVTNNNTEEPTVASSSTLEQAPKKKRVVKKKTDA
jgi:hypothetical protein